MKKTDLILDIETIQSRIFTVRGVQIMLDKDLAEIYQVETKVLNQAVKRNIERFPETFRFQINHYEIKTIINNANEIGSRSQIVTLNSQVKGKNIKYLPYAFTEQGISMLSTVLRSTTAIKVSISIMNAFVEMRKFILNNASLFQRLETIELKQIETDKKFDHLFKALDSHSGIPKQGIFFDGQIFDAYTFVCDIIKQANESIILIDNYIDESVLTLLTKRKNNVEATIYTKSNRQLLLDLEKHNKQYPDIIIRNLTKSHDRFIIIDKRTIYHIGASLKDLGKKWFAFTRLELDASVILSRLS